MLISVSQLQFTVKYADNKTIIDRIEVVDSDCAIFTGYVYESGAMEKKLGKCGLDGKNCTIDHDSDI